MPDYNRGYDTTQVDTPENRRGMVRILEKYSKRSDGTKPFFKDPEGSDEPTLTLYLRVLADYSDTNAEKPAGLEAAMAMMDENDASETYLASFYDHLRYIDLLYLSPETKKNAEPAVCLIGVGGEQVTSLPAFTRRKLMSKEILEGMHTHHASIYELLDYCEKEGVSDIMINPDTTNESYRVAEIRACLDDFEMIDEFWYSLRRYGIEGRYLFPLLVTDFLYRTVRCVYGDGQEVTGVCVPAPSDEGSKVPGIFIDTDNHSKIRISLDDILFIQGLPDEEEEG